MPSSLRKMSFNYVNVSSRATTESRMLLGSAALRKGKAPTHIEVVPIEYHDAFTLIASGLNVEIEKIEDPRRRILFSSLFIRTVRQMRLIYGDQSHKAYIVDKNGSPLEIEIVYKNQEDFRTARTQILPEITNFFRIMFTDLFNLTHNIIETYKLKIPKELRIDTVSCSIDDKETIINPYTIYGFEFIGRIWTAFKDGKHGPVSPFFDKKSNELFLCALKETKEPGVSEISDTLAISFFNPVLD